MSRLTNPVPLHILRLPAQKYAAYERLRHGEAILRRDGRQSNLWRILAVDCFGHR